MITIKQLAKHISSNTLTEEQIDKVLQSFYAQTYEFAVQQAHNKFYHLRRKRKDATTARIKKDWDKIITKLRDKLNK